MRNLRGPTGIDHVDLRRHLVQRPQPTLADQREDVVGVIVGEHVRCAESQLLRGVPNAVVGARLAEVVTHHTTRRMLLRNEEVELFGGTIHHGGVAEGVLEYHDSGTVGERAHEFGLHGTAGLRLVEVRNQRFAAVHRNVLLHRVGERIVGQIRRAVHGGAERVEVAVRVVDPLTPAGRRRRNEGHGDSLAVMQPADNTRNPSFSPQQAVRCP